MQGGRGGRGSLFGFDPFADFGGLGGFGGPQSLLSSVFGGRDPFDDPFFTRPFGSPFDSMFESNFFGPRGSPFAGTPPAGFIDQREPQQNKRRGPVIEEINSDDENDEDGAPSNRRDNSRKHSRLDKQPCVEIPDDDEADGKRNKYIQQRNDFSSGRHPQPQSQCFTFQSSSVSYGGTNGAYYTKSMTRRAGSDGVTFEEFKEADSATGQANHRISRGIHDKGHTLARKLNSDGRVDTMQTLHNLNEDELTGFEQAWEGSAGRHLPGWRQRLEGGNAGPSSNGQANRGGWALPSTQQTQNTGLNNPPSGVIGDAAAAHIMQQENMRRAAEANHAHNMRQSRARAQEHALTQQHAMRRAGDHGPRGRPRA